MGVPSTVCVVRSMKSDFPEHAQAMSLAGAKLFDPSGKGRPMKAWVVLGPAHAARVPALALAAARPIDGLLDA